MVTFSLPGDGESAAPSAATPRSRPPLPFAKRAYAASPYGGIPKRLGTPHSSSSRAPLLRDDQTPSSLSKGSLASARNIFRASAISDSPPPPSTSFAPNLPSSTPKRVFAPGATPEPSRFRGSTAQATPRGVAAAKDTELFSMRISSPPKDLTGEHLARRVPKDWNPKGSIYADQFLTDLCPPDLDEEQRRQFFCILDLRRLKYAADEIFARKDWKLNVINFAKEFEKSRSIILLRYGLYEFKNVKPSKEVLKRWRREHGLPEPEEEEEEAPTPSKAKSSKKRKADTDSGSSSLSKVKRRASERDAEEEEESSPESAAATASASISASASSLNKNKRKASVGEEDAQPAKKPSQASSLFQKIANKSMSATPASPAPESSAAPKANPFTAAKPAGSSLARSVFNNNMKSSTESTSSNIFGHLSDTGSGKNSVGDADAESDSDSSDDGSPEAGQSDGVAASAAENASQAGSSLFGPKPSTSGGFQLGGASGNSTRESTPGPSLFDRVSKSGEDKAEGSSTPKPASAPLDQTWNPSATPLKFAPSSSDSQPQSKPLFGSSTASTNMFAPKTSTSSNLFGAAPATSQNKDASASESDKAAKPAAESDKENESKPASSLFGAKTPAFGSSQPPTPSEPAKETETKPSTNLFGATNKTSETPASSTPSSNLFGAKPAESSQSSTLFGAKPAQDAAAPTSGSSTPLFGTATNGDSSKPSTPAPAPNLFGAKPAGSGNLFGSTPAAASTNMFGAAKPASETPAASTNIFGAAKPAGESATPSQPAEPAAAKPTFSFGAASSGGDKANGNAFTNKPLFGAPKSPPATNNTSSMFGGSPMKQDEASPAKKPFPGPSSGASAAPTFSFGGASQNTNTANIFGNSSSTPAANPSVSFGGGNAASANGASGNAGFSFGSTATTGSSFNNPFAAGGGDNAQSSTPTFNFGASSTAPSAGGGSTFQFGGGSSSNAAPAGNSFSFGGNQGSTTPQTSFGGASNGGGAPTFSFGAGSSQAAAPTFGGGGSAPSGFAANLQPPAGASTNGTNTPFSLGGNSSLATTPAAGGTPEPSTTAATSETKAADGNNDEDGEKHEQINLTDAVDDGEENLHEVRAKILKYVPADPEDGDAKAKSPWSTQGVGKLRLLKNKESNLVRLLLRAEPRGNIAMNRAIMSSQEYKADKKYVKLMTSNEKGDGLETWMIQVKTTELATDLAAALEKNKEVEEK